MPNKQNKHKHYFQLNHLQNLLFFKMPKFLLKDDRYASLTNDDRMAYMLISDRFRYSEANGWIDKRGIYIFFTVKDMMKELHISEYKATQIKQHLTEANLIDIEHAHFDPVTGKNLPDKFYLSIPEYDPKYLISSPFPKIKTIKDAESFGNTDTPNFEDGNSNANLEKNPDIKVNQAETQEAKKTASLDNTGTQIFKSNKDNNFKDTMKDTNTDTQIEEWNFDSSNYSQEIVEEQNRDLLHNLANTLSTDPAIPMFLSKESINLITLWFKTPKGVSDCISVILNAANSSRRDATEQIGRHELYFEDCQGELKRMISFKLRRFFNKMRTSKKGAIKSPRNYLFIAMRNMFDKWQNDILMAEHKANASA
ncbi:replication initiator protein A [Lactobacillus crispatus]|uniref:Replication initiator protein A n=1 Tax=Lactobacillus crispatus TaxID=47770 RepID=A0AB37DJ84_9LACO|nr:replication initiator protein A [Lactobacillus crispatus]OCX10870.1 hypothetical protein BEV10_01020 [Lactobacillus crispatus]QHQ69194.1 hypothetical protein GSR61_11455 [Lactobacillus crispatus]